MGCLIALIWGEGGPLYVLDPMGQEKGPGHDQGSAEGKNLLAKGKSSLTGCLECGIEGVHIYPFRDGRSLALLSCFTLQAQISPGWLRVLHPDLRGEDCQAKGLA